MEESEFDKRIRVSREIIDKTNEVIKESQKRVAESKKIYKKESEEIEEYVKGR